MAKILTSSSSGGSSDESSEGDTSFSSFSLAGSDLCAKTFDHFPCPRDSYGDVIVSFISAADGQLPAAGAIGSGAGGLWLGASCFMYLLMFAFQLVLSFSIQATSIEQNKRHFEAGGAEVMMARLHAAVLASAPLDEKDLARKICDGMDIAAVPTYFLLIMIWFLNMMDKLCEATWLMIVTQRVRVLEPGSIRETWGQPPLMHCFDEFGVKKYHVNFMTPGLQRLCGAVAVTKWLITVWITWVGINFLVFVNETKVLVLKALVCSFFMHVGENSFSWLASEAKKQRIAHTSFCYLQIKTTDWSYYGSTFVRSIIVVVLSAGTWYFVFHSVRGFRWACIEYKNAFPF